MNRPGTRTKVSRRIKRFRQENGLSQAQLARSAGVTRQAISLIEQGKRDVTLQLAIKVAEALGVTVGELVGERSAREVSRFHP